MQKAKAKSYTILPNFQISINIPLLNQIVCCFLLRNIRKQLCHGSWTPKVKMKNPSQAGPTLRAQK